MKTAKKLAIAIIVVLLGFLSYVLSEVFSEIVGVIFFIAAMLIIFLLFGAYK